MSHLTASYQKELYRKYGDLKVLDDVVRHRAADSPPTHILGYPRSRHGVETVDDYENFTGKQLDMFVDAAAKVLMSRGLEPNARGTVALLAPSNVDFLVSLFALSRLGYTVLCLSLRIPLAAIVNLVRQTDCRTVVHGHTPQIEASVAAVSAEWALAAVPIPPRAVYDVAPEVQEPRFERELDRDAENGRPALIMHSSGSTGLPKPVTLSHRAVLMHTTQGAGMDNFGALPWYHLYGISTTLQAMYTGKTASIYNAALPLTSANLIAAMDAVRPQVVHAVPYALGLLAETPEGVERLKSCARVTSAGARTPDELGDRLVSQGVNLGVVFGTTEAGLLGDSMQRDVGDDSWNYVRIYAVCRQFVVMESIGDKQYEAVYLRGHPALSTSNSDEPAAGSWRSKDVFTPHPTIPDVWKYVTRLDDRVTLTNGEKVLPLPIEGRLREDALIREAVVFGVDRPIPGLLVFRAPCKADAMPDDSYLDAIWPSVADANLRAEAFSQVTRDMVVVMPPDADYPRTDKGSIIHAQTYARFAREIDDAYSRLDAAAGRLRLDLAGMEDLVMTTIRDAVGVALPSVDADLFAAGVDNLKALQTRRILQKTLDLNGQVLPLNVVYERRNARQLARHLHALARGLADDVVDAGAAMEQLAGKYSDFADVALLTGVTGSLGAHTLARLARSPRIRRVYCLVRRAGGGPDPMARTLAALRGRGLALGADERAKVVGLAGDVAAPDLGLDSGTLAALGSELTLIVHAAWAVNFNLPLASFEGHMAGLQALVRLSLGGARAEPALLLFCSSVSAALNTPGASVVPDGPVADARHAARTGYAQSKWVAEQVVLNAARAGARSYVLRIGQISGDGQAGVWNDSEAIPSLVRSALSLEVLPDLGGACSWLPVDTVATTILELSQTLSRLPHPCAADALSPPVFYNVVNPHVFAWRDLLAALRALGLRFRTVPVPAWLQLLRDSAQRAGPDPERAIPALKLLDYFAQTYDGEGCPDVVFDTTAVRRDSVALRSPPRIIEDSYVAKYVAHWMKRWAKDKPVVNGVNGVHGVSGVNGPNGANGANGVSVTGKA